MAINSFSPRRDSPICRLQGLIFFGRNSNLQYVRNFTPDTEQVLKKSALLLEIEAPSIAPRFTGYFVCESSERRYHPSVLVHSDAIYRPNTSSRNMECDSIRFSITERVPEHPAPTSEGGDMCANCLEQTQDGICKNSGCGFRPPNMGLKEGISSVVDDDLEYCGNGSLLAWRRQPSEIVSPLDFLGLFLRTTKDFKSEYDYQVTKNIARFKSGF